MPEDQQPGALLAGAELPRLEFGITRADLVRYAAASGDPNPIHQDEQVARSVGLPGVIAHGMLTLALAGRAVAEWTGGAEVVELGATFVKPVVVPAASPAIVGFTATVTAVDDGRATLALVAEADGQKVLGRPRAVVRVAP